MNHAEGVFRDLEKVLTAVPEEETQRLLDAIVGAPRVFVYGLGRSGLMARAWAMRLVHMGQDAVIVGGTTTPAIRDDDLLVICSRTGRSPILRHAVHLAHSEKASAAAIVGLPDTPIVRKADLVLRRPIEVAEREAFQPMGSLFEQALLLDLEGLVVRLMERLGITAEQMERVHFNLP